MYVADTGNDRVQKLSPAGQPIAQWGASGTAAGQFDQPFDVTVDGAGNVYVVDAKGNRVERLTQQ